MNGYFIKYNKLPSFSYCSPPHSLLGSILLSGRIPSLSESRIIPVLVWNCIKLERTFEYDFSCDTNDLLSDKACAPPLQYWTQSYDICGFRLLHNKYKPKFPYQETRVILRYLKGHPNETRYAIERIERDEPREDTFISIVTRK